MFLGISHNSHTCHLPRPFLPISFDILITMSENYKIRFFAISSFRQCSLICYMEQKFSPNPTLKHLLSPVTSLEARIAHIQRNRSATAVFLLGTAKWHQV
jgi:hypothetical protein